MATVAHLVEKLPDGGDPVYDNICAVVIAIDDLVDTTDALVRARAVTVLNAAGIAVPSGYFDTNRPVATTFDAVGDVTVFNGRRVHNAIA